MTQFGYCSPGSDQSNERSACKVDTSGSRWTANLGAAGDDVLRRCGDDYVALRADIPPILLLLGLLHGLSEVLIRIIMLSFRR